MLAVLAAGSGTHVLTLPIVVGSFAELSFPTPALQVAERPNSGNMSVRAILCGAAI
jgi:hypothetical protein